MKKISCVIILAVSIFMLFGCSTKTDYDALTTWEFKNASSYAIEVNGGIDERFNFSLAKDANHSFDITVGTGKEVTVASFISPYIPESTTLKLDGERIVTISNITDREHYIAERVAERHYKFTYTFTDADFPEE